MPTMRMVGTRRWRCGSWRSGAATGATRRIPRRWGDDRRRWLATETEIVDGMTRRAKGLEFEARVVRVMQTLHCHLTPTQVSMDGGIDHVGHWKLPDTDVEVVTQCKNEQKPVGVQHLREFHGVLALHAPTAIGLFFSASGYSIYAQRFFTRTTHPAILCTLDEHDRFTAFYLNDRARAALPKLSVGSSFIHQQHELILTYGELVLGS